MSDSLDFGIMSTYMTRVLELEGSKYKVFAVPGDGDCFFNSLSLALFGNFSQTRNLRLTICSSVYSNWAEWLPDLNQGHDAVNVSPHKYYQHMILHNGWATVCEIKTASAMLRQKINVWLKVPKANSSLSVSSGCTLSQFGSEYTDKPPINVLLENQHFQLL